VLDLHEFKGERGEITIKGGGQMVIFPSLIQEKRKEVKIKKYTSILVTFRVKKRFRKKSRLWLFLVTKRKRHCLRKNQNSRQGEVRAVIRGEDCPERGVAGEGYT
jgi:hypothetical protein